MTEHREPEINVAEVMRQIKADVAIENGATFRQSGKESPFDWSRLMMNMTVAEQHADAGSRVLPMIRFHPAIRWLVRLVGRVVVYLAQVVTIPQRMYNQAVLQVIRDSMDGVRKIDQSISHLQTSLTLQERRFKVLLDEAIRQSPQTTVPAVGLDNPLLKAKAHLLDPFYVSFEDRFRGSRDEIKQRLKSYLPFLKEGVPGQEQSMILDIGCGRGEWLELLRDAQLNAKGIDLNQIMVDQCREKGLAATEADALAYLMDVGQNSLGAVTAFHLIEHLELGTLVNVINEIMRVLRPGGLVLFETPNPENIAVGACNFYADPTHRNPIFPPTIQFIIEQRGFSEVKLLYPQQNERPSPYQYLEEGHPLAENINPLVDIARTHFSASADFAVIGWKVK